MQFNYPDQYVNTSVYQVPIYYIINTRIIVFNMYIFLSDPFKPIFMKSRVNGTLQGVDTNFKTLRSYKHSVILSDATSDVFDLGLRSPSEAVIFRYPAVRLSPPMIHKRLDANFDFYDERTRQRRQPNHYVLLNIKIGVIFSQSCIKYIIHIIILSTKNND